MKHIANPIEHHGQKPAAGYTPIVNEVVRDGSISSDAFRVLALLLSHTGGYEESANNIAARYGWGRRRAGKALAELEDVRLLVIQQYRTEKDTRAFETYHVNCSQRFTDGEVARLRETVVLSKRRNRLHQSDTARPAESAQTLVPERQYTEEQTEKQTEEHREDSSADVKEEKKIIRPQVAHLVQRHIPEIMGDHKHLTNVAVKAMVEMESKPTLENIDRALRKWAQDGNEPGELWRFIDEAVENDVVRVIRGCLAGDVSEWALQKFGHYYSPPGNPLPIDRHNLKESLAKHDAWHDEQLREWLQQLLEKELEIRDGLLV